VLDGGIKNLDLVLAERIKRLGELAGKMDHSIEWLETNGGKPAAIEEQKQFRSAWPGIKEQLGAIDCPPPAAFIQRVQDLPNKDAYTAAIQSLDDRAAARAWLQSIVDQAAQA